jgi:hypothetical protein
VIENVSPAIVNVVVRVAPLFAATWKATVPLPLPLPPAVIEAHGVELEAVHEQPAGAATPTLPAPPGPPNVCSRGEMEKRHGEAACSISSRASLTVTAPFRERPSGLAAIFTLTLPLPCPVDEESTVSHAGEAVALQVHSCWVATVTLPVPPFEATTDIAVESDT